MDQQEQSLIDRIKQAQNVLVTVSNNPSVDQLAAAIGLTVALNKMDKHGTAVFSGQVPSTLEFLKPEETLEKNTDSLRDFIIALDKSKADKLRYKVEDEVVRIFITPYKTSLSEKDLEFSQGDFNVDVVVALGVSQQQDIDAAITAHGRILHDATVTSISMLEGNILGTINWVDTGASSLSEMMLNLIDGLDKKLLDNQIATALLTGIVASTDRFRNEKTTPKAMSASAELMAAGANQQLIATELEAPPEPEPEPEPEPVKEAPVDEGEPMPEKKPEPGELDINHDEAKRDRQEEFAEPAESEEPPKKEEPQQPQIHVDENGLLRSLDNMPSEPPKISDVHGVQSDGNAGGGGPSEVRHERLEQPPMLGDASLTANASPDEEDEPPEEQYTLPKMQPLNAPLLKHNESVLPSAEPALMNSNESPFIPQAPLQPAPADWQPPEPPKLQPPEPLMPPAPLPEPLFPPAPAPLGVAPAAPMPPVPAPTAMPEPPPAAAVPMPPPPPTSMSNPFASSSQPTFTTQPLTPPVSPAAPSASPRPDETLDQIEKDVNSPHLQASAIASSVDDARSAVEAVLNGAGVPSGPIEPITALNAQPLGPDLHPASSPAPDVQLPPAPASSLPPTNAGFSEPSPGNTPADATLDMPLPSNPFGPGQQASTPPAPIPAPIPMPAPPSSFPGTPPSTPGTQGGQMPPPPVPPPLLPPM